MFRGESGKAGSLKQKILSVLTGVIAISSVGCMTQINFERYSKESPLVVVYDGLFSVDARNFIKPLAQKQKVPYILEDNVVWESNQQAIKKASEQKRKILLIGYSSGCDQVRLTAKWCDKQNIPIEKMIFFDPTYLSCSFGKSIPKNVRSITNYLSQRGVLDILEIGKGREIKKSDLENPETNYENIELDGPHLGIFRNNQGFLESKIKEMLK